MTKEDFEKYKELDNLFSTECERVAQFLQKVDEENNEIRFAEKLYLDKGEVYWEGYNTRMLEECHGQFVSDYLFMSDEELQVMVDSWNTLRIEREKKLMIEKAQREWDEKQQMYEKLKKELGYD